MIAGKFVIQAVDSGAYAAPVPSPAPFTPSRQGAAVYAFYDAIQRAEELMALTGHRCSVIPAALEWDFKQSVDFRPR